MIQERHRHDFYFILVVKKGTGQHEIDFTNYEIKDCSVFVMRPGQVHQLWLKSESTGYIIQFKTDLLYTHNNASQNHLNKISQNNAYFFEPMGFEKIEFILEKIATEFKGKAKGYQEILKANLSILLIEMLRQRDNKTTTPVESSPYAQEKLEKFLALVELQSAAHKQVSYYTEALHLSSYQLNAITKTQLDKTPSEIINEQLILEAKRQLLGTSNQVSQIADHLGYDDVSYFIRFFKKHTGYSPEAFRQNFK